MPTKEKLQEVIDLTDTLNEKIEDANKMWEKGDVALGKQLENYQKILDAGVAAEKSGKISEKSLKSMASLLDDLAEGNKSLAQLANKRVFIESELVKARQANNTALVEQLDLEKQAVEQAIKLENVMTIQEAKTNALNKLTFGLYGKIVDMKTAWGEMDASTRRKIVGWGIIATIAGTILKIVSKMWEAGKRFAETIDSLGETFGVAGASAGPFKDSLIDANKEAILLGKGMTEIATITTTLSSDFGISAQRAADLSYKILDSSTAMGLTAEEGAKLFGMLMSIGSMNEDAAEAFAEQTYQLALQNKVAPQEVMKDIAENAEYFALFSKDGGKNLRNAAIQAKKLGIELSDVQGMAEGLLNFESQIKLNMEAQMLTGRKLNLDEATRLAYLGDHEGMMKEVLKQAGSLEKFNEMDHWSQKARAAQLHLSLGTLKKMLGKTAEIEKIKPFKDLAAKDTITAVTNILNQIKLIGFQLTETVGKKVIEIGESFIKWIKTEDGLKKIESVIERIGSIISAMVGRIETMIKYRHLIGTLMGALAGAAAGGLPGALVGAVGGLATTTALTGGYGFADEGKFVTSGPTPMMVGEDGREIVTVKKAPVKISAAAKSGINKADITEMASQISDAAKSGINKADITAMVGEMKKMRKEMNQAFGFDGRLFSTPLKMKLTG